MVRSATIMVSIGALCLSLGACASAGPAVPQVAAMPGKGKSYAAFQRDDQYCQGSAQAAIGGQSPGQAANDAAVGSAVVGTALGAAAHSAGTGAAIGAGSGLLAGSAFGAGNARAAGGSIQSRFDMVYAQCMSAKGNDVGGPAGPAPVAVVAPAPVVYAYPRPYYYAPGPWY